MADEKHPTPDERAEPLKLGLDPEDALRGLLKVDPDAPPANPNAAEPVEQDRPDKDHGDKLSES
jgi:hypothetical protein